MIDVLAVVSFCLAFLAAGYSLGRLAQPGKPRFELEPDPLRDTDELEGEDDVVVPIEAARSARSRRAA